MIITLILFFCHVCVDVFRLQGTRISFFDFAELGLDQCRHIEAILSPASSRVVDVSTFKLLAEAEFQTDA